jgi:hypothetical protein
MQDGAVGHLKSLVLSQNVDTMLNLFTKSISIRATLRRSLGCGTRAFDVGVVLPHHDVVERTYRSWLSIPSKPAERMSHRCGRGSSGTRSRHSWCWFTRRLRHWCSCPGR